jgi:Putative MetA-pathway of phenol degradation
MKNIFARIFFLSILCPTLSWANDKSNFTLFNPVPQEMLRPLSADRPDFTESPYTVDAGHFQLEMDFVNAVIDDSKDSDLNSASVMPFNFKMGLTENTDFQIVFEPYINEHQKDKILGKSTNKEGVGDLTLRFKQNFFGNDSGDIALGSLYTLVLPTNQHDLGGENVQGGIAFPFAIGLEKGWSIGIMPQFDLVEDQNGNPDSYHVEFLETFTVSKSLTDEFGFYTEVVSISSTESDTDWTGVGVGGIFYAIDKNTQLDLSLAVGLTEDYPDFNPYTGITKRF